VEKLICASCGRVEVAVSESTSAPRGGVEEGDAVSLVVEWSGSSPRASDIRALRQLVPDLPADAELIDGLADARECRLPESRRADAVELVLRASELGLRVKGF
jgi:hypothetical protein